MALQAIVGKPVRFFVFLFLTALLFPIYLLAEETVRFTGINLAGGEFGGNKAHAVHGKDYIYPTLADITRFADIGMNVIRVPFLWERIQPKLNGPLNETELSHLDAIISIASARHMAVILDPHNYGAYRGKPIGSTEVPINAFTDFWGRLAKHYKDEPYIVFGLMNEPIKQSAEDWASIAQKAIFAIRKENARQLILVPGTIYTGAHSWDYKVGKFSNAEALSHLIDPEKNFAIEVHQYFDSDNSGTHSGCVSDIVGVQALAGVTAWLKATENKGFLGEFGAADNAVCKAALDKTLAYMQQNSSLWLGWTYWGASAWFGDYMFNIMPPDSSKHGQINILKKYLSNVVSHGAGE
jgi:endoglucanase